jgi:hypothetical protein
VSGYDRYIGTLGAIADAPTGSNFANYLTLPAAEKYDQRTGIQAPHFRAAFISSLNFSGILEQRLSLSYQS